MNAGTSCVVDADSDWVAAEFAAIIAVNWPEGPGIEPQRVSIALAVRADRDDAGGGADDCGLRPGRARSRPVRPASARERSPPRPPASGN
jgi:hypothetical protein